MRYLTLLFALFACLNAAGQCLTYDKYDPIEKATTRAAKIVKTNAGANRFTILVCGKDTSIFALAISQSEAQVKIRKVAFEDSLYIVMADQSVLSFAPAKEVRSEWGDGRRNEISVIYSAEREQIEKLATSALDFCRFSMRDGSNDYPLKKQTSDLNAAATCILDAAKPKDRNR